jgi:hypothetical protein
MKTLAFLLLGSIANPARKMARPSSIVAVVGFAFLCVLYAAWPVWRAFFPMEIDLKEPWNAYHSDAVFGQGVLYPDLNGLIANNYPPLWYYLTGALSQLGVDTIYLGRALSFVAMLVLVAAIALCIRQFKAAWPGAILGGLFFFGIMVRYADWYVAMNDPHVPALAIMMVALVWFLRRDPARGAELPILLMVVAGFFKQAIIAIPAMTLFLLAQRSRWLALRAALVGGSAALAGLALFTAIYGRAFFDEIFLYPREMSFIRAWGSLGRLGPLLPALVPWAIWVWNDRKSEAARFSTTFVLFAFAGFFIQKMGAGTDINAMFELYVAVAVATGLAFDRITLVPIFWGMSIATRERLVAGVLALSLVAAPGIEAYLLLISPSYREQFYKNAEMTRAEIERIAAIPGPVHCDVETVCRAAGKPFVYDDFFIGQLGTVGRLTLPELGCRVLAEGFRREWIDLRASDLALQRELFYGRSPIQFLRGEAGTLGERLQLGPLHTGVDADDIVALRESAVRAGKNVLTADQVSKILNAPCHKLGVLDDVR